MIQWHVCGPSRMSRAGTRRVQASRGMEAASFGDIIVRSDFDSGNALRVERVSVLALVEGGAR
jgi:hypothetical protein